MGAIHELLETEIIGGISIEAIIMVALYLIIGFKVIKKAVVNISYGEIFDENFLMTIASIASICIGEYHEAVMVMLLYRIGEYLQSRAVNNSRKSIMELVDIRSDYANLEDENGEIEKVDPANLQVGDIIKILPGERVPADGIVVSGSSRLDTAALTGESMPADVSKGNEVLSGSINLDGLLRVRVTRIASESTAARILELVENAAVNRAKTENFITRFARYYTPAVCGIALVIALVPGIITGNWSEWIRRAVIMLVVSCPCALVISIPLGFFGGIGGASKRGILIKGGNYLETLSKSNTIIFDKTGTLTKGVFSVIAIHPNEMKEKDLLELAAYAESFSNHPIARSLADEYGKHIDKAKINDVKETAGQGITANVNGKIVACGNQKYMDTIGVKAHECSIPGTIVHVVVDGTYAGHIVISDVIKDDSKDALDELKNLGVEKLVMLTGDKEIIARSVSEKLPSLDEYRSGLLPEDKVNYTKKILDEKQENEKVAFVGDGINDAPVLTIADVGIAMGGMGTAAAVEAADIVLMNDKPSDVALAVRIARKTMRIVKENIAFSLGVKFAVIILAAFGYSSMWLAEFADVGVCLLAILNSMRAMKIK